MPVRQFLGISFTAFSMFEGRTDNTFGADMGLSLLNQNIF